MASVLNLQLARLLRDGVSRNQQGEYDLDTIFNRELYPAIKRIISAIGTIDSGIGVFPPIRLTGASNAITTDHQHKNLLVSHTEATSLTLSESVSEEMPSGTILLVSQEGVGQLTLVPQGSVNIRTFQSLTMVGQYAEAFLVKTDDREWYLFGDLQEPPARVALVIQDRFIGGNQSVSGTSTNANIGELQWNTVLDTAGGTVARVASAAGRIGIVRVTSNGATGRQSMYLGHQAVNGSMVNLDEMDFTEWDVSAVGPNASNRLRFGFGNDAAGLGLGAENFRIEGDSNVGFWQCVTTGGGSATIFTTDIPIVFGEFRRFRLKRVSSLEYQFFIDGDLVYTAAPPANLPASGTLMGPALQTIQVTAASISEIDTFTLQLKAT